MRLHILPLILGVILLSSFSSSNSGIIVKSKKTSITIDGKKVVPDWSLTMFKGALGEADRDRDGYNKTHTYDKLGIVLFEPMKDKMPSGIISEVQIYFNVPEANNVTPKGTYNGLLKIDKMTITSALDATTMLAKLKGWKKTDSYIEHSYRMARNGFYIYFQFNDSETGLVKVSIGPDKRAK